MDGEPFDLTAGAVEPGHIHQCGLGTVRGEYDRVVDIFEVASFDKVGGLGLRILHPVSLGLARDKRHPQCLELYRELHFTILLR